MEKPPGCSRERRCSDYEGLTSIREENVTVQCNLGQNHLPNAARSKSNLGKHLNRIHALVILMSKE